MTEIKKKLLIDAILLFIIVLVGSLGSTVLARPFYRDISIEKTYNMIFVETHFDLLVIDIRPPFMYSAGYISGAENVPIPNLSTWIAGEGQNHLNDKIIVHCYLGTTSPGAAQILIDAGFKKVYSMEGGFNAWTGVGYPTVGAT